jgi:predicted transcriptional regulator
MNATPDLLGLTSKIVGSYMKKNYVSAADLPGLIQDVYRGLTRVVRPPTQPTSSQPISTALPSPAEIRKSIKPDGIVSFENGKTYKSMKRSLSLLDLTPEAYRTKWGLPKDYPIVAPSYSASRSALAKSMGLGVRGRQGGRPAQAAAAPAKSAQKPPKGGKAGPGARASKAVRAPGA